MTDPTVTLHHHRDADGTRHVRARLTSDGALVVEGQDLGPGVERIFGRSEYEWALTVPADEVEGFLASIDSTGRPVLGAVADHFHGPAAHQLKAHLDEHGITHEFWSRIGD